MVQKESEQRSSEIDSATIIDGWISRSGQQISVVDYHEHAIGSGTKAEAVAYVRLNINSQRVSGAAFDHVTVSASLKAVLSSLNRSLVVLARAFFIFNWVIKRIFNAMAPIQCSKQIIHIFSALNRCLKLYMP